ncbi:probable zinc finger protein Dzip1 at N-terminal half [Coccomyxa sp. Obi]|nr:probable zinc finger protein Dzip1 at N-terminal half [Coccomyxa sp. Obi]
MTRRCSIMGLVAEEKLQDNQSGRESPMPAIAAFYGPTISPGPAPFRFSAHQTRINWQILHGVDIDKLVRETDIDTLERCCAAMAYGDLQAEEPGSLSETNFRRLFRLAQLTVEYLLHIQDRLVWENGLLKEDKARSAKHVEALHLRVKEHKEELAVIKQEAKSFKKSLKAAEAALKAERDSAEAKGASRDSKQEADLMWQVERLQRQSDELRDEREGLLRDIDLLKDALEKAKDRGQQDLQAAVEAATRREQAEADRRVLAAKEEALQVSQGSIDDKIAAATEEMRSLRQRLADSLIRQQELETRLKLSSILGESKTTVVAAADNREELERLTQRLRNAEDDATQLRSALRDQEELGKQKALASSEGREESTKELEQLRARLEAERAERERLEQVRQELERDGQAMRAQVRQLSRELSHRAPEQAPPEDPRGDPEAREAAAALQEEVEEERRERTLLEAKVRRLQSMLANSQPQQEELIKTIHFLERELELERSASARSGLRLRKTASMERHEAPVQDRGHFTARASMRRSASAMPTHAAAGDPENDVPPQPSPEDIERFNAEMAHELAGAQRPGVRSRFPQPLPAFEHTRAQLEGEMEEELNKSLRSFGVDPASGRMSDAEYAAAAAQLESRRSKALAARPRSHRERAAHLHSTILWHIYRVASKIRRKGQLRPDGAVGPPTLQTRASQRLSMDTGAWTGRQRAFTGGARRARSSSPVRQGSSYLDRGYDSDDESTTGRFHGRHTLSQSLAADPMVAAFGDAYSPLRSAIRPGSFTFKSAQELGSQTARESWVPVSAGLRPSSPRARSPTRLAKFSSAPGDFTRQRSVLARYETPPPLRARTAGAADLRFSPVTDAGEAPYYPPARARTAGPSVFSPVSAYTDDSYYDALAHGASSRYEGEPAGYEPPLRGRSAMPDYTYENRPQRTRTVEVQTGGVGYEAARPQRTRTVQMQTERADYDEVRPQRTRTVEVQAQHAELDEEAEPQQTGRSSRAEKEYVLRAEKSFTKGFKAGLEAARSFSARAAAEAQAADAEGAPQETGVRHSGGMRRAASSMAQETGRARYHEDGDLRRSRSAPRPAHVRYQEQQEEEDVGYRAQQHSVRQGSSGDEHGSGEEAAHAYRAESLPQREADVPEVELPSFEALVERQKSQQDMRYGAAYSPMGASSPALAQALASQTSEYSTKSAAARTASRLRNASISVPQLPEGNGIETAAVTGREWEAGIHEGGAFTRPEAHAPRGPITSSSLPASAFAGQTATRAHAHDLRPYSSVGSSTQAGVKYAPNPVYEGVRTARLRMEESGSGLRHEPSSGSFRTGETSGDNGLYDSARSVTARQQEAHQQPASKPVSTNASFQQATGPARSASAATFGSGTAPIHAWAGGPLKSAGSMQPSGAAGLRSYASSPSWGKGPSLADGLQGRRMATAREFQSTEHASSIKLA